MFRVCPICKSDKSVLFMKSDARNNRDGVSLKKCKICSFVYSSVSKYKYEDLDNGFVSKTKEELLFIAEGQRIDKLVQDIVKKSGLKNGTKVLDFGCGVGFMSLFFQKYGFNTFGIEKSIPFLEKHKELNIQSFEDLKKSNFEKNMFDLIILKDVLEHLDNPTEMLEELISYLKPNGFFYIRVPNLYHYPFHWSIDTEGHINHFTPKTLNKLFVLNNMKKFSFVNVYDIKSIFGK